jgi:hypothetical protein
VFHKSHTGSHGAVLIPFQKQDILFSDISMYLPERLNGYLHKARAEFEYAFLYYNCILYSFVYLNIAQCAYTTSLPQHYTHHIIQS